MSVFSDRQIKIALNQGQIVCYPLEPENIRGSSIDVTLGENFYWCGRAYSSSFFNPFSPVDLQKFYGEPQKAKVNKEFPRHPGILDHPVIMLPPRTRILAHTHEFIGIRGMAGTAEMRARSSWGRLGVSVCLCAGWGDPGYVNRWTMEIQNFNDVTIPLPVGERVGQVIFHQTGAVDRSYGEIGKYQSGQDIQEIVKSWEPSMMLPKNYKDERKLPISA